jgi:peptidoglycan hydrolase CwlO-like protein
MPDLKGALLAAAEEASKMQDELDSHSVQLQHLMEVVNEQDATIKNLNSHIDFVEHENTELKNKLRKASNLLRQFADIFDEN